MTTKLPKDIEKKKTSFYMHIGDQLFKIPAQSNLWKHNPIFYTLSTLL